MKPYPATAVGVGNDSRKKVEQQKAASKSIHGKLIKF